MYTVSVWTGGAGVLTLAGSFVCKWAIIYGKFGNCIQYNKKPTGVQGINILNSLSRFCQHLVRFSKSVRIESPIFAKTCKIQIFGRVTDQVPFERERTPTEIGLIFGLNFRNGIYRTATFSGWITSSAKYFLRNAIDWKLWKVQMVC